MRPFVAQDSLFVRLYCFTNMTQLLSPLTWPVVFLSHQSTVDPLSFPKESQARVDFDTELNVNNRMRQLANSAPTLVSMEVSSIAISTSHSELGLLQELIGLSTSILSAAFKSPAVVESASTPDTIARKASLLPSLGV